LSYLTLNNIVTLMQG